MNITLPCSKLALVALCAIGAGCGGKSVADPSAKGPALAGDVVVDKAHNFAVERPKGWTVKKNESAEDVLTLGHGKMKGQIAVAVPKLPVHIPGMIPLGAVQNGYVDDVRKRLKSVAVPASKAVKVAGVLGREFTVTGDAAEGKRVLEVLALARGDVLYIVTAESPASEADQVRKAFEELTSSWKWIDR